MHPFKILATGLSLVATLTACGSHGSTSRTAAIALVPATYSGPGAAGFYANLVRSGAKPTTTAGVASVHLDMLQCQVSGQGPYCWLMAGGTQLNAGLSIDGGAYRQMYDSLVGLGAGQSAGRALEAYADAVDCQQTLATMAVSCKLTVHVVVPG